MTSAAALPRELAALAGMFNAGTRIFEKTVQGIPDEKWFQLFPRGSRRVPAEQYPRPAEILDAWKDVSAKLPLALDRMTPELLSKPASGGARSVDGTVGGTVSLLSFHEVYHIGQMGYLRKWLGYGQVVG